jgi:hypothetical protein
LGVSEQLLEAADDAEDNRSAYIQLILEHEVGALSLSAFSALCSLCAALHRLMVLHASPANSRARSGS